MILSIDRRHSSARASSRPASCFPSIVNFGTSGNIQHPDITPDHNHQSCYAASTVAMEWS